MGMGDGAVLGNTYHGGLFPSASTGVTPNATLS